MGIQMRVTEGSIQTKVLANLQRNIARGGQLQEQLSSGKQINRPSDSPIDTVTSMQLRGESRSFEQYSRNADDGLGWLNTLSDALSASAPMLNRARDLTLQGLNAGTDVGSREALAIEIDNIKKAVVGFANSKYRDRLVFGGTAMDSLAYDETGSYKGDTGQVTRTIGRPSVPPSPGGDSAKVRVDVHGPEAFGAEGTETQLFAVLQGLADSLRSNDMDSLRAGMKNLDVAGDVLNSRLSDVGARYNRVSQMRESAEDRMMTLKSQLSEIEDIDLPKTIMEMKLQETSYEAALAATAKVIQPSLLDYLR